jgi:uncharacterized membrane protein
MTIVYLLLVYRRVDDYLNVDNVPRVAITLGSALSLVCIFLLLFYVHHLASSIVSDTVIGRVGDELDSILRRLLPEPGSTEPRDARPGRHPGRNRRSAQPAARRLRPDHRLRDAG